MKLISSSMSFGGMQNVYSHESEACRCVMTFAVYLPPQAATRPVPVLWYLSGLTCTHQNVMEKGEYRRAAAELGVAIICPDTSPRGADVPDEPDNWLFGQGAGFYLDATQAPYATHYNMERYVTRELPVLLRGRPDLPLDFERQSIMGHSMGGHGAIMLALKNPGVFRSVSAFSPISQPITTEWAPPAYTRYLGADQALWRAYDATCLMADGARIPELLVDQGLADPFLERNLRPQLLADACRDAGIPLSLNLREGYDHSYFFISTFMPGHLAWHASRLG